ncbi:MAG: nucleotidyltransferase family protein [Candidatus Fermentithermobacillus carboniphilus]|uniref:Nucleotidyltransferase family protein n=1 Tax=Candidatus Fermentithermobacillus carboniphilus TaxID=3085328 RepID=A0AAT9LCN1_9FIRM|nr:MAG: nucleotidyltransferase family protein [Candidatus Fermentithermobacillus carboniphilus]
MIARHLSKETVLRQLEESAGIIKEYGVRRIGIFGSVLRGEAREDSDLDVLVEFSEKTFDKCFGLKVFLEDLFGAKIDLVIADKVKSRLRGQIFGEVEYAAGF